MTLRAAIDIGSNSIRLLIAQTDGFLLQEEAFSLETTRLGATSNGQLTPEAFSRSVEVIVSFAQRAEAAGVAPEDIVCFATAAVREAANGPDFVQAVARACGVKARIIPGQQEAALALRGVRHAFPNLERLAVLDIGGASTECAFWGVDEPAQSVPIGAVKLMKAAGACDVIPPEAMHQARQAAKAAFAGMKPMDIPWIGVGGGITTAASVVYALPDDGPAHVNGRRLVRGGIDVLAAALADMPQAQRNAVPGMQPQRAEVLPFALVIASEFLFAVGARHIEACGYGNLHGALLEAEAEARGEG